MYLLNRVLCRIIVVTCDGHSGVNDVEGVDDSACDKDDKRQVLRSVLQYYNSLNSAGFEGMLVSLPAEGFENYLEKERNAFQ